MEYQVITPEGVEYLKSVTAPDRVFYGDEIEYDYAHDEMPDFGTHAPDVLVEVLSTEEVSKVMRYAYEHCIPVTPRGAGTRSVRWCCADLRRHPALYGKNEQDPGVGSGYNDGCH